jgi:hypothetical protein
LISSASSRFVNTGPRRMRIGSRLRVVQHVAHVGRHQVRGELIRALAFEIARARPARAASAQPGHALDQHVAAREQGHEHLIDAASWLTSTLRISSRIERASSAARAT